MTIGIDTLNPGLFDRVYSRYSWFICFSLAYISSFVLSGVYSPTPHLDPSYQVVLEFATTHNFQFGRDIVFTFGPLGFLDTTVSQGLLPVQRVIFALVWSGLVAWSVAGLARQIQGAMKYIFLVWFLIYSNPVGVEQHAFLVMVFGCMVLMGDVQKWKGKALTFLMVFAFLALIKFTIFIAATFSVIVCSIVQLGRRNLSSSVVIVALYGVALFALWGAFGQRLKYFWPWLKGNLEIAGGYTDAMTIFPKASVLVFCTVAGTLFLASLIVILKSSRLNIISAGLLVVTTSYVFLSWKHSFVRADGHTMGYILFLPLAFSVLFTDIFQKSMDVKPRRYLAALFIGVVLLSNWAADLQEPGTMLTKLLNWPNHMSGNSKLVVKSVTGNWENFFEKHQQKLVPDLPVARSVVGMAPVDVVNYTQWAALANNLNYRPRPVIQGYAAYTPYLQDLNLAFYQSEKRPQYLLFKIETIDNRFPALDDATLLPYILTNYRPVAKDGAKDGGFLVLKALPKMSEDLGLILVHEHTVAFGESLDMPAYNDKLYVMRVEVSPTIFGKMIKFFFQAPVLTMNTQINGKTTKYRFIPAMAERGFVVNPILLTNDDVMHYYERTAVNCAESISFSKPKYTLGQLSNTVTVRLYKQEYSD